MHARAARLAPPTAGTRHVPHSWPSRTALPCSQSVRCTRITQLCAVGSLGDYQPGHTGAFAPGVPCDRPNHACTIARADGHACMRGGRAPPEPCRLQAAVGATSPAWMPASAPRTRWSFIYESLTHHAWMSHCTTHAHALPCKGTHGWPRTRTAPVHHKARTCAHGPQCHDPA